MIGYVDCEYCGKEFEKEVKHINYWRKKGWKLYCSKECQIRNKTTAVELNCNHCGQKVIRILAQYKRSKSGNIYCSRKCATIKNNTIYKSGENHPNYTGGKNTYRKTALEEYGAKCKICGYSVKDVLEVHHIDCDRANNTLENLIVLCPTHHKEYQLGLIKVGR